MQATKPVELPPEADAEAELPNEKQVKEVPGKGYFCRLLGY